MPCVRESGRTGGWWNPKGAFATFGTDSYWILVPMIPMIPMIPVILVALAFSFVGNALRDALDPFS